MLKQQVADEFLGLFNQELVDVNLENGNLLNLFILQVRNNRFIYNDLVNELADAIIPFALSRHTISELGGYGGKQYRAAVSRLRAYCENKGELGELLLYCFLDSHLKAPKLLSKLEIKSSKNHYSFGADGVHLLKLKNDQYQIIFGESKLNSDLSKCVYNAFRSCSDFLSSEGSKMAFESGLIGSQLLKEAVSEGDYQFLKSLLMPAKNKNRISVDHSFGFFLGFDCKLPKKFETLKNEDYRLALREHVLGKVRACISNIIKELKKQHFSGYQFYLYVIPFTGIDEIRVDAIRQLTEVK